MKCIVQNLPGCRMIPARSNPSTYLTDSERALLVAIQRKADRRVASLVGESLPMERALVKLHTDGRVLFHQGAGGTQPLAGPMVRITPAGEAALKNYTVFGARKNPTKYRVRAPFMRRGRWGWHTWTESASGGNKHEAVLAKARELDAERWDFGQTDYVELSRANF